MSEGVDAEHELRCRPQWVWGLPLMPYTLAQALQRIRQLVERGTPSYFITANLHYAMLTDGDSRLRRVNERAAFIIADGMPLVWASRLLKKPVPERVAGADLIWKIAEQAASLGQRMFLLGGGPGIADEAGQRLREKYPGLQVVGTACPPFRELSPDETANLIAHIRAAQPHILFVAFGQPKGEYWIHANFEQIEVPVSVQVGASFDFVAGKVRRAPRIVQRLGMEWAYRLYQEPRRLLGRYARDSLFLFRMLLRRTRNAHSAK